MWKTKILRQGTRSKREGKRHILFHDQNNVIFGFEGIIQLDKVHVVQLVHDIDFILNLIL